MVFTDPPYNVDYQGKAKKIRNKILNDKMSEEAFFQFLLQMFGNIMGHVSGAFYVCMSSSELHNLWAAFTEAGGHFQSYIIWVKNHFTLSRSDYQNQFEPILIGSASTPPDEAAYDESEAEYILYGWIKHTWNGGRKQPNVWHFDRPMASDLHPTMKPVMLCAKAIQNSSSRAAIVLDIFLGSGSTLIACEKTGRVCYGMELDRHYCDVIVERWCEYTGRRDIICNDKEIYWTQP